jgi:hypothetical protein
VHARFTRAIHDWEVTFVECLRLRCCGKIWSLAPAGVRVRSRYSDRVVALARSVVSLGLSVRECAKLLDRVGVCVSHQTVHEWCAGVRPLLRARVETSQRGAGNVRVPLRHGLWLAVHTNTPARAASLLDRERRRSRDDSRKAS